jgi:small GTP-binding protein
MQKKEFKITLLGQPEIGKTIFLQRLYHNTNQVDNIDYRPTLGVDVKPIEINNIRLNIWDCAGDERYRGLKAGYHIDTKGAIIFRKNNDYSYLNYLNKLPENTPINYIDNYNIEGPNNSIDNYKNILYNFIQSNYNN